MPFFNGETVHRSHNAGGARERRAFKTALSRDLPKNGSAEMYGSDYLALWTRKSACKLTGGVATNRRVAESRDSALDLGLPRLWN